MALRKTPFAVALLGALALAPAAQGYIYWPNGITLGTIGRANLDGTGANQNFIAGAREPFGIAVDNAHVYWANESPAAIGRANLDGTGANQDFITGLTDANDVFVDGSHVYWTDFSDKAIGRANLDGSGVNQSFISLASGPYGVAVNGTHIYWVETIPGTIGRADLNGTGVNESFITGANGPQQLAIDSAHIYWTNDGDGTLGRANLDGSSPVQNFISGIPDPCGVAVDGAHVYWANGGLGNPDAGTIGRADLDGSQADGNFITGANNPCGVAVDALPLPPPSPIPPAPSPPVVPAISGLRMSPPSFRAAGRGGSIARKAKPVGTRVTFTDSQAAITTFTVLKPRGGVKRGKRCVKPPRRRSGKTTRCTLTMGSFKHRDTAGTNSFRFTGRVRHRKLGPGRYRLQAVPNLSGQKGPAVKKSFRIVRR